MQEHDAASNSNSLTTGGFGAGRAFGVGAVPLVGGGVLFSAAWRALRDVNGANADLAAKRYNR